MVLSVDLNLIAELREMVLRPPIFETAEISSSVMPSAKYSSPGSGLMLLRERMATYVFSKLGGRSRLSPSQGIENL
jgi:hypothetical protein